MTELILKSAHAFQPSGEWRDDDYDELTDGSLPCYCVTRRRSDGSKRSCGKTDGRRHDRKETWAMDYRSLGVATVA
jgi:hypothetical protein